MKRFLSRAAPIILAVCAVCLLAGCVPRPAAPAPAPSAAESPAAEPAESAPPLAVTLGEQSETVGAGGTPPAFPVSDPAALPVLPDGLPVTVTGPDGNPVFSGPSEALASFLPPANDSYRYEVSSGDTVYRFSADCALPAELSLPGEIPQGETAVLRVRYADGLALSAESTLGFSPRFFPSGDGGQTALLPVRYSAEPGVYGVTVTAGGETLEREITVTGREFEVQYLEVDPATAEETALSAAANAEWEQKVEPLKAVSDPERYWENPFLQPVAGEITTQFGCIRYTNDDPIPSRHGGIDIAARAGAEVPAANNGRVLFAERIQLTGNTVVVEHGYGLKSFYYHMDSLHVSAGDFVRKGDLIGTVGTTGYSTGPHLHFALAVNNVFVNPWTAFDPGI